MMVAGLDAWPEADRSCRADWDIRDERLEEMLGTRLRLPPAVDDERQPRIPLVRFPLWHYCPVCRRMQVVGLFAERPGCDCQAGSKRPGPRLLPVPYVAVCGTWGHIQDFPFMEAVHDGSAVVPGPDHVLRLRRDARSAGLAGVLIECSCGQSDTMRNGIGVSLRQRCGGQRPWLGEATSREGACGQPLYGLSRNALNVYFASTVSALHLPLWRTGLRPEVAAMLDDPRVWQGLTEAEGRGELDQRECRTWCLAQDWRGVEAAELLDGARRRLSGSSEEHRVGQTSGSPDALKEAEYAALCAGKGDESTDLVLAVRSPHEYAEPMRSTASCAVLAHKLRETRVLTGFSRHAPAAHRGDGTQLWKRRRSPGGRHVPWLPAVAAQGEGVFVGVDESLLKAWEEAPGVAARVRVLAEAMAREGHGRRAGQSVTARFVMLHTLAHMVIGQLSFDCGYGVSSIRERIYSGEEMAGFLVYTAGSDADGAYGGLVRQGEPGRIDAVLRRSLQRAIWCSYDPVCMESDGQGPGNCNLAACHGCVILPETCCEYGNRLLDRGLVVGRPDDGGLGFYGRLADQWQ